MPSYLRKCTKCGTYTMELEKCPKCCSRTTTSHPPNFSPEDPFANLKIRALLESNLRHYRKNP
ncbi:MAG: nucleolar RNA-binding Nop10p family protein [Thermoproteota archaeon]